jgi:hypothetical protein
MTNTSTIQQDSKIATLINVFTVEPCGEDKDHLEEKHEGTKGERETTNHVF